MWFSTGYNAHIDIFIRKKLEHNVPYFIKLNIEELKTLGLIKHLKDNMYGFIDNGLCIFEDECVLVSIDGTEMRSKVKEERVMEYYKKISDEKITFTCVDIFDETKSFNVGCIVKPITF